MIEGTFYVISEALPFFRSPTWATFNNSNIVAFDTSVKNSVVIIDVYELAANIDVVITALENNNKLIIDSIWEPPQHTLWMLELYPFLFDANVLFMFCGSPVTLPHLKNVVLSENFFRVQESLFNKSVGLDKYAHQNTASKKFLMLLGARKPHRTLLYEELANTDNALISNLDKGIKLPLDKVNSLIQSEDRQMSECWYNDTHFSVVAESCVYGNESKLLTEKTYKPIAFNHPFILVGQPFQLRHLRTLGFETFPHLFDERYDVELDSLKRIEMVGEIARSTKFKFREAAPLTKEITDHNRAHFYDMNVVNKITNDEIVVPLMEFINA